MKSFHKLFLLEIETKVKDQEKLIEYLRQINFKFVTTDWLDEKFVQLQIKKKHEDYSWLIKRLYQDKKNPLKDIYDHTFIFGIRLGNKQVNKVQVYYRFKYYDTIKKSWPKEVQFNFKKIFHRTFPKQMSIEERVEWRDQHRKFVNSNNPDYIPSDFYKKWAPLIK